MANGSSAVFFSALEALVNFAYNGRVEIDQYNVQSLLIAASFLHLQSVKDACCDFLKERWVYSTGIGYPGDKNISTLHLSCRTSDLQFSLVLQTHALVL